MFNPSMTVPTVWLMFLNSYIWHWPWNHIFFNLFNQSGLGDHKIPFTLFVQKDFLSFFVSPYFWKRLILIIDDIVTEQRECLCHSYSIFSSVSICWVVPMVPQPLATTSTFREAFCSQKWRHSSHQVIFPISKCMLKMFLKFRDCIFSILFVPPKNIKINLGPPEIQNMFFGNKLVCKWG